MKHLLGAALLISIFLTACQNNETPKTATAPETKAAPAPAANADSIAIADAVHGFFTWYDANSERLGKIQFVNDKGKHLTLDEKQFAVYLEEVRKSGFVSETFLTNETKFYHTCAKIWQTEAKDEVPTGLDADRFLCAQDFIAPYNTGKVTSDISGDGALATLTLTGSQNEQSIFTFDLKKENGKWLLAKLGCDMGVKY